MSKNLEWTVGNFGYLSNLIRNPMKWASWNDAEKAKS